MNIVFLCTSSLDDPSPRGRWLPLSRELARRGHRVHLLLLHPTFDRLSEKRLEREGVHVEYVGQMHVYGYPGQRTYFGLPRLLVVAWRASLALAKRARELCPGVIHVAKPQPINGLAALLAARRGARLYVDCDDYEAEANRFSGPGQRLLVRWWEDHLPRRARAVSVNTHFLYERNRALGVRGDRLRYVPNGVEAGQFVRPDASQVDALKRALSIAGQPTVIYLGTLSKVAHGTGLLLDAFARVLEKMPTAQLLMVGDGDDRPALQAQAERLGISANIRWMGRVPHEQTPLYFCAADCSVDPVYDSPAARARSPMKVVESMALGVPVVAGDAGDRRELLVDGAAGLLVPAGEPQALASGLFRLLGDGVMRAQMSSMARERACAYRWETLAHTWQSLYDVD